MWIILLLCLWGGCCDDEDDSPKPKRGSAEFLYYTQELTKEMQEQSEAQDKLIEELLKTGKEYIKVRIIEKPKKD